MIKVTSNINEFLERFEKRFEKVRTTLMVVAEKLSKKMTEDMNSMIKSDKRWQEHGNLSKIDSVDFRIEKVSSYSVRVHIGENLPRFEMSDGTFVNPAFFVEFGFGIVGQEKPKEGRKKYGWEYNINNHKESWFFWYDGILMESEGREGLNFIYETMQKYKDNLKYYIKELLEEQANG